MAQRSHRMSRLVCAALVAAVAGVTGGCGSAASTGGTKSGGGAKATAVKIGDITGYSPSEIEANILAEVAGRYPQLGVSSTSFVTTDVPPGWVGLERGDTDVFLEADMPNQQALANQAKATTSLVGPIYANAGEGWFVPSYVLDGAGAPAPGLHSIAQLNSEKSVFGDTLYDDSPGWVSTADNTKRLAAYGLGYKHIELSDALLVAQVEQAEKTHKPILFFFYHPHWLFTRYKFVQLAEPHPFTSSCFTSTADSKCALPSFSAYIAARNDLKGKAPRFYAFLSDLKISGAEMQELMAKISLDHESAAQVAQQWVSANQSAIKQWVAATG